MKEPEEYKLDGFPNVTVRSICCGEVRWWYTYLLYKLNHLVPVPDRKITFLLHACILLALSFLFMG